MERIDYADYADMAFQNIEEVHANNMHLLRVKALIFHSAIVADHVDLYPELDSVQVLVKMALTRPNKSGLIEVFIPLGDRVNTVTFGKSKTALWKRGATTVIERTRIPAVEHSASK